MTFCELKVAPWFVHRLVGDTIWNACWAERAPNIMETLTVPQKLLSIATHVAATLDKTFKDKATDQQREAALRTIAEAEKQDAQRRRDAGKAPRQNTD